MEPSEEAPLYDEYTVVLARSGAEIPVHHGETILGALLNARIDVSYSCEQGICGACETKLLSGTPEHRDSVRSPEEHARLSTLMICCAGSRSKRLTIDL
jgi:vanillate O-demethylase ferredoxin subunit